jgi:FkbM family methyltransferase
MRLSGNASHRMKFLRSFLEAIHSGIARAPDWLAKIYISGLSTLSRTIDIPAVSKRLQSSLSGQKWPKLDFSPREIIVGEHTSILLHPHLGEFDESALFSRRFDDPCDNACFRWLETYAAREYDAIIDIGANVGLYTIFFDRLSRQPDSRLKEIFSFEPAREPYRRLLMNLRANACDKVTAFPIAIGETTGFQVFFEPEGHLVNGSFSKEFASLFSSMIVETPVMVLDAKVLQFVFERSTKLLIKIDAENYEPLILRALSELIIKCGPDIILEVLPPVADAIETSPCLSSYNRFLITTEGPKRFTKIEASADYRDWLLRPTGTQKIGAIPSGVRETQG